MHAWANSTCLTTLYRSCPLPYRFVARTKHTCSKSTLPSFRFDFVCNMRCLRRERRRRRWRRQEFWRTSDVRLKNTLCAELGTPWHSLALPSECILPSYASKQGVAVWTKKKKNKLSTFFNNLIYLFWHSCCSCCCCLLLVAIAVSWHDMGFPQPQSYPSPCQPAAIVLVLVIETHW